MADFIFSIAPIFLMIVLGHVLRRSGFPNTDFWNFNDQLVYWVLMPCLIFYSMSTAEISFSLVGTYAIVILGAFSAASAFGLVFAKLLRLPNTVVSSVLQGAARHNTFIALAVAERLYGSEGLALATLIAAILIPVTNLTMVPALTILHRRAEDAGVLWPVIRDLARNPLILSIGLGVSFNLAGLNDIPILSDMTRVIGGAALPIVLMCVGANIHLRAMQASTVPLVISVIGKMIVFPVVIVLLAAALGLSDIEMYVALLFGAVPTASSAYTLARQLGGDAPLMAAIVTIQTAFAFATLPATFYFVQSIL